MFWVQKVISSEDEGHGKIHLHHYDLTRTDLIRHDDTAHKRSCTYWRSEIAFKFLTPTPERVKMESMLKVFKFLTPTPKRVKMESVFESHAVKRSEDAFKS